MQARSSKVDYAVKEINISSWWQNSWSQHLSHALVLINRARGAEGDCDDLGCSAYLNALSELHDDFSARPQLRYEQLAEQFELAQQLKVELSAAKEESDAKSSVQNIREKLESIIEVILAKPSIRLASYGTLRPGQSNYKIVSNIQGVWLPGTIRGSVREVAGYPAYTWSDDGEEISVEVLCSEQLIQEYSRVDEFEGVNYKRTLVPVLMDGLYVVCNVYETTVGNEDG